MQRRQFLSAAAGLIGVAAGVPHRAQAGPSGAPGAGYGYATNSFVVLKGGGNPATFDDAVNATTSVSMLSFDAVPAIRCATEDAVTADVGIGPYNGFVQPGGWNGGVMCAVYFDDIAAIDSATLFVGTRDYAKAYARGFAGHSLLSGWNMLAIPAREFNAAGESLSPAMVRTKLRIVTRAATAFHIAYFAHYQRAQPKVLLIFDGGFAEQYSYLRNQLLVRQIPCAVAIDTSAIGRSGHMTQPQVQALHNDRSGLFTIANFGFRDEPVDRVGVNRYMGNVMANRARLNAWGCANGRAFHVYARGAFNDDLVRALRTEGFVSARQIGQIDRTAKTATRAPLDSMTMLLPASCRLVAAQSPPAVRACLANGIRDGGTTVIMGHRFDRSIGGNGGWPEIWMNALLDDLVLARKQGDLDIMSWPDWYRGLSRSA